MVDEFISVQDRIISSAIEIISDGGLSSLTPKIIAMRTKINETMLYKYYGSMDELLLDVIEYYFKFDDKIFKTVKAKKVPILDKIRFMMEEFTIYFDNYYALSNLMLHYEEMLHNSYVRDAVVKGYTNRRQGITDLFDEALKEGEINPLFTAEECTNAVIGVLRVSVLNRRFNYKKLTFKEELADYMDKFLTLVKKN